MLTIYFCLADGPPVARYWPSVPRIGDTIELDEFGMRLAVYEVVWEGSFDPVVRVYVRREGLREIIL